MERKLRAVCRASQEAFGQPLEVTFRDRGWAAFQTAMRTRNLLTHPKTVNDCYVEEDALQYVDVAEEWFRGLHNELIRVAREHRESDGW